MKKQTQQLRKKVIEAAGQSESDELLQAALEILNSPPESDIWASPEIKDAWMEEIARRKKDIDEGRAKMIPGDEVMRKADKIING